MTRMYVRCNKCAITYPVHCIIQNNFQKTNDKLFSLFTRTKFKSVRQIWEFFFAVLYIYSHAFK